MIPIGPRAQALLRDFFTPGSHDYLFSPQPAVEEVRAARAERRKTPLYPSHRKRNEARRAERKGMRLKRPLAERHNRGHYETAVARACDMAFPSPAPLARQKHEGAEVVQPKPARSYSATSKDDVTQLDAERNLELATEVARKVGESIV